jgi:hypothetical protein
MLSKPSHIAATGLTLAGLAIGGARAQASSGESVARHVGQVSVFRANGFPSVDGVEGLASALGQTTAGSGTTTYDSPRSLADGLRKGDARVLVLPYGSAFPVDAWPAIKGFLDGGGSLVVLGGSPFAQPVRFEESGMSAKYVLGLRHPTYAHELLIGPSDVVATSGITGPTKVVALDGWTGAVPEPSKTYALTIRLGTRKDMPSEHGSEGPKDGVVRPLVHVLDRDGIPRAAPVVMIDRLRGAGAGGRWVFAPSDAPLDAGMIRQMIERALEGAGQVEARPVKASIEPGEMAAIRVVVSRPRPLAGEIPAAKALLKVTNDAGAVVAEGDVALEGTPEMRTGVGRLALGKSGPGLYRVEVTIPEAVWSPARVVTGVWIKDAKLLASGSQLRVSRDWLRADGKVMPVVGTTYMASDVHRKFLFEPNPHVWDRDFREMSRRGINLVRTGLWTAWSRAMLDPGVPDENVLSALDAYVASAARNGVHVCFTFFAFQPPYYGGSNTYLDDRSLEGQRALLTLVASRYRGVPWVHWDLINEPSYSPPDRIWSNQPVRDPLERRAWADWLTKRHGDDEAARRESWRDIDGDLGGLPEWNDMGWAMIREGRVARRAHDFAAFSQEVVAGWAARLRAILKAAAGDDTLVTLGQDEGGTQLRPAQQLHYESLDYTAVHTWWNNDDLLWDGVMTKVPEKPNLHQETGLMRLEDVDGNPWRSPEDAARLLERKVAYAFASRGAGVVQWAWNINPYQPIDNESVIGLFRPDGTAKPELRALTDLAAFFKAAAPLLDDFEPDPVVMVIPHARLFAGRPGDLEATKRTVRLLAERFGVVPTALSDQKLTAERLRGAKLILVPAPDVIGEPAAQALLAASRAGSLVMITGAVEGDPYGRVPEALRALGVVGESRPLVQHERTAWGWATFDGQIGERIRRGTSASPTARSGNVWHEPIPLEYAREPEPLAALLQAVLAAAGVTTHPTDTRIVARLLTAPRAVFAVCVNETAEDGRRRVTVEGRAFEIPVPAGRSRLVLFERGTGKVLAATPGGAVEPVS